MKAWLLLLTLAFLTATSSIGAAAGMATRMSSLGLGESFVLSKKSLVKAVYYSDDLSKVVMLAKKSHLRGVTPVTFAVPQWRLTVSQTKDLAYLSKGLSEKELELIAEHLQKSWTTLLLQEFLGPNAQANGETCLNLTPLASAEKVTTDILRNVSVKEAVKNCKFDLQAMLKNAIESAIETYTDLSSLSLSKLTGTWDSLQYAVTQLAEDVSKALSPLATAAPKLIEAFFCEMMKSHVPGLVMAAVLPGGARNLPFKIAKIVDEVKDSIRSPTILKLVADAADKGDVSRYVPLIKKVTHQIPDSMRDLKFHESNLSKHFVSHKNQFPEMSDVEDYRKRIQEIAATTNTKIVHFCRPDKFCTKMNSDTGEYLVVAPDGHFVSFFRLNGRTPAERFTSFLVKNENHSQQLHH